MACTESASLSRKSFCGLVTAVLALSLMAAAVRAHIVVEAPWHPLAASYRTMLFFADLQPVPWDKISTAFEGRVDGAYGSKSARDKLQELETQAARDAAGAIEGAIAGQDRQALYETASRALALAIATHLDRAAANLGDSATAAGEVKTAQELYRAIEEFVRQADSDAFRKLGRAWLVLTSSTGTVGVLGDSGKPADEARFREAAKTITSYLDMNYSPDRFTARDTLTPLPETVVADKGEVEVQPWLPPGSQRADQDPLPLLVLNFEERGIDEADLPLIAYGDMLFDSPQIFGERAKALGITCSMCHNRSDINQSFFIPGMSHQPGAIDVDGHFFNPVFNDRKDDPIDIPSLRGIRFTGPYGRDGRIAGLRDFTRNVIVNEFGGAEPTPFMLDALVAYMLEFDFLPNSKLTGDGMLTDKASEAAKRGETLFRKPFAQMDGKSCASCHIPSANFVDRRAHDIGSQAQSYGASRDGAYDTPTLLGTKFTAPYFHNGMLPTLASVVDWFNDRYGLKLADKERADLTAYLEAVGDADAPYEVYEGRNTPFRLAFEELTTFATTLNHLLPARDKFHAKLMIDTVSTDLSLDASGMDNRQAKHRVYKLANTLKAVGAAIDADDWTLAEAHWAEFQELQREYDESMF